MTDCVKSVMLEILMKKSDLIKTDNFNNEPSGNCIICQGDINSIEDSLCKCGYYPSQLTCCGNFVHTSCITHTILKECPLCRKSFK